MFYASGQIKDQVNENQSLLMFQDTMIICNFNGTLMDKGFWGDPDVFRPDRFIDSQGNIVIPEQYTPFGYGKLLLLP
jgi:methyl farnesoate epoxidase/farnesoate epoxidase